MTILNAQVDTASIDVDIDTHQLKEIIEGLVALGMGKVAGADFVATLDSRVIHLEEIIEGQVKRMLATIGRVNKLEETGPVTTAGDIRFRNLMERTATLEEERGLKSIAIQNLIERVAELEDADVHALSQIEELTSAEMGKINDRIDDVVTRVARLEEQREQLDKVLFKEFERYDQRIDKASGNGHEMKYEIAMQEIQRTNERVDGFCFVEDRRDEAEIERQDVVDKLNERVSRLEGTEAKWTSRINQDPTKHVPMIQEGHIVHTCNNMGTDKETVE